MQPNIAMELPVWNLLYRTISLYNPYHPFRLVGNVYPPFRKFAIGCMLCSLSLWAGAQTTADWPDEDACLHTPPSDQRIQGWCLTILRTKGNCVACHTVNIRPWPDTLPDAGNIAPPLVAIQPRFPDLAALRLQIADAPALNPGTSMPPYERHELLSAAEIDQILAFLLTL